MSKKKKPHWQAWTEYGGRVASGPWRAPSKRGELIGLLARFAKLWFRVKRDRLFWPPLMEVLQEAARRLLGTVRVADDLWLVEGRVHNRKDRRALHEAYYSVLGEIMSWRPDVETDKIHIEVRVHEPGTCAICRIELKWPAYIIMGRLDNRSGQIGVHCLERVVKKMELLLKELNRTATSQ